MFRHCYTANVQALLHSECSGIAGTMSEHSECSGIAGTMCEYSECSGIATQRMFRHCYTANVQALLHSECSGIAGTMSEQCEENIQNKHSCQSTYPQIVPSSVRQSV